MNHTARRTRRLLRTFIFGTLLLATLPIHDGTAGSLPASCQGFSYAMPPEQQIGQLGVCLQQRKLSPEEQLAALKTRATLSLQSGRPEEALSDFSKALTISRRDPECYQGIAIAYKLLGKEPEAQAYHRMAQELRGSADADSPSPGLQDTGNAPSSPALIQADRTKTRKTSLPQLKTLTADKPGKTRLPTIPR